MLLAESVAQRHALQQLVNHKGSFILNTHVVYREDVRMIDRARGACLLFEKPQALRLRRDAGRQNLDRDVAPDTGIARAIGFSHAAGAQKGHNLAVPEHSSQHRARTPFRKASAVTSSAAASFPCLGRFFRAYRPIRAWPCEPHR